MAKARFKISMRCSPIWNRMATEFASYSLEELRKETLEMTRAIATEMITRQIPIHVAPSALTHRLDAGSVTWRHWTTRMYTPVSGAAPFARTVTIGFRPNPPVVSPEVGRDVRIYGPLLERGSARHYRPWGRLSRARIEYWGAQRGFSPKAIRGILVRIFQRGTLKHPFFEPAARATEREAVRWLERGGMNWRNKVERRFLTGVGG